MTKNKIINRYTGNEFKNEERPYDTKMTVEAIKETAEYGPDLLMSLAEDVIGAPGMVKCNIANDIRIQYFYQFADMDAYNEFKKIVYPIAMEYMLEDEKKTLNRRMEQEWDRLNNKPKTLNRHMEQEWDRLNNKPMAIEMPEPAKLQTIKLDEQLVRMISDLLFVCSRKCGRHHDVENNYGVFSKLKQRGYDKQSVLQIMGNNGFLHNMFDYSPSFNIGAQPILPRLIISGGINPKYKIDNEETKFCKMLYTMGGKYDWNDVLTKPEAIIIYERLQKCSHGWVGDQAPLLETESINFKDHFVNVDKLGGYKDVEQLRIFTTAESALRAVATARKQLPKINDIAPLSYVATLPQMNLTCDKEHWANHPLSQQYVCAELAKVSEYHKKGDIALTHTEAKKLYDIAEVLKQNQR